MKNEIYLPHVVGRGYKKFWEFRGRYRVVKGSRASKKSKTTALWFIRNIIKYPTSNVLVIRKTEKTLKQSCYTDLKWAIHRLEADRLFKCNLSPLEITYTPTGQKILFRGLDDPLKITSISVDVGCLCWVWIEEAYEIMNEEDFDFIDESIRGTVPDGLFKQITITFNPWNEMHWLKRRFFDVVDPDILAITTNYTCNEWLDEHDLKLFLDMKKNRPKRYQVAGLGNWGAVDGMIFDNWKVEDLTEKISHFAHVYNGLDFGFEDPNALVRIDVEVGQKKIYVFDELYQSHLTVEALSCQIQKKIGSGYVTCDSASPQNIFDLSVRGIRALSAVKGPNSILFGIQWLQSYDIIIHKDCVQFISEISNYQWQKDKFGRSIEMPVDENNHLMDALRYATEALQSGAKTRAAIRL